VVTTAPRQATGDAVEVLPRAVSPLQIRPVLKSTRQVVRSRQAAQLGHVGLDTGHGPVVDTGGGLVAIAAAVDRAEFLGGHSGGGDLAVMVAGLDAGGAELLAPRRSTRRIR
jgi:hypothetical protein